MNIDQMKEKLRQEMPEGLEEIEIAKYIYITLGKMKSYDETYYFGNSKTQKKIYNLSQRSEHRINETMEKRKIICVSLSHLYVELLKKFNIKALTSIDGDHVYVNIYLKDDRKIKTDLQLDLSNIQARMRTKYFGSKKPYEYELGFDEITNQENTIIDKNIGYIDDNKQYRDEDINNLKIKCSEKTPKAAIETIINDESVNNLPQDMGYVDRGKYYINLFKICMPNSKFDLLYCYRYSKEEKDENGEKLKKYKMILGVYGKNNEVNTYTFSERENKFIGIKSSVLEDISFKEKGETDQTYWTRVSNSAAKRLVNAIKIKEKRIKSNDKYIE